VQPNIRRLMPMFLVLAAILFIVPALTKKHSSGPSGSTKATATTDAMLRVGTSEQRYRDAHARYTAHTADLVALNPPLAADLASVSIQLDVSTDGQSYVARVSSDVLSFIRVQSKAAVVKRSCTVLKSGKGVACPPTSS
jgi:hypothetical protein